MNTSSLHLYVSSYPLSFVYISFIPSAVEDLRYQHVYHPVPLEQKCPALANVINQVGSGAFGDAQVYEPYVRHNSLDVCTYTRFQAPQHH